ncbi:MAG: DsrE family protein [Hyphomicrobiaceae bacterium]
MSLLRNLFIGLTVLVLGALPAAAQKSTSKSTYKVAFHVDENNPAKMNLTLNNVKNIIADFSKSRQKVEIEVVTYGPGLHMFRDDTSPVKARIHEISLAHSNVTFAACANTQKNMAKAENKEIKLISEARLVPSGVVRLVELQRKGYAYIKP